MGIFFQNTPNFMKILQVGAELFHAEGQTDVRQLIVAFPILWKRLKIDLTGSDLSKEEAKLPCLFFCNRQTHVLNNVLDL
jgi:hypothetical protein